MPLSTRLRSSGPSALGAQLLTNAPASYLASLTARKIWTRLDLNQRPSDSGLCRSRDSLDYLIARRSGRGRLLRSLRGLDPSASLCTFSSCSRSSAQDCLAL